MTTVKEGNEYTAEIEGVSSDGNGVAHIDGMAVFVPYTAAGDTVKITITDVKKRYAKGVISGLISPSSDRTDVDCPYFGECGGCSLRHIRYERQLEIKKDIVENAMRRIGGFSDFKLEEIIGMENPSRYRNKAVFHSDNSSIGFYSHKTHNVIPLSDCAIGAAENTAVINAVKGFELSELLTRKSFSSGEIMVCVSSKNADKARLCSALQNACGNVAGIYLNGKKIYGKKHISDSICGINFKISPESFFQVNPVQTERLYKKALAFAAVTPDTSVLDIYCGIGTISLCAAKKARAVTGVEIVERAIEDAKENAALNNIENASFYAGRAEKIVPHLVKSGEKFDVVILDPPRKGSEERTLGAIVSAAPQRIVYVSCDCATLARDAKFLARNGYTITRAAAVDLFPHTAHVETVVLLTNSNSQRRHYDGGEI